MCLVVETPSWQEATIHIQKRGAISNRGPLFVNSAEYSIREAGTIPVAALASLVEAEFREVPAPVPA